MHGYVDVPTPAVAYAWLHVCCDAYPGRLHTRDYVDVPTPGGFIPRTMLMCLPRRLHTRGDYVVVSPLFVVVPILLSSMFERFRPVFMFFLIQQ